MITVTKSGLLSVQVTNNVHTITSDVSKAMGGEDSGLNPHELIEAALGACTTLTLELYAKRKNWDLSDMVVEVKITKEDKEAASIERKITFGPQLNEEDKKRLTEIANKCPIHQLLTKTISIETLSH